MNFCVHIDNGAEIHGYFVPDGFSTVPVINVRLNNADNVIQIPTWIHIEGARAQGAHQTGNVGFVLYDANVPGISSAEHVELSDPETGLVFYRRAKPGRYLEKKVLRVETSYVPQAEIDVALRQYFQFFETKVERFGFETIRQMLEIIHQPSVFVSGRILLRNFRTYINYNIDTTMISLRDPFYELAMRLIIFSRLQTQPFRFVPPRDMTLFKPVIEHFNGLVFQDEDAVKAAIRNASKDAMNLLASPFTQQLVAASPSDSVTLDDVSQALDMLSQFSLFDSGYDPTSYAIGIADLLDVPVHTIASKPLLEPVHHLSDVLRKISRVEHILEADMVLYHFIREAERKANN
jgi:hypothetical protein